MLEASRRLRRGRGVNPLEIARLRHHAVQLRVQLRHTRGDNAHLRELLRRASSYVKAVADDDEVRLELVNKLRLNGRNEVGTYFSNYSKIDDWQLVPGLIDGRAAVLVRAPGDPTARPAYFILVAWDGSRIAGIRDFRFARYAIDGAEIVAPG